MRRKKVSEREVLFFTPFSGIWKHALVEFLLMRLVSKVYKVSVVRCDRTFSEFCTVMNSKGLDLSSSNQAKLSTCRGCLKNARKLMNSKIQNIVYQSPSKNLDFVKLVSEVSAADVKQLLDLEFLTVPIGKLAVFETILKFKKTDLEFTDTEVSHMRNNIRNAALSVIIAQDVLLNYRPKFVFVFNPQYSVGGAFSHYCSTLGIKVYALNFTYNASENTRAVSIWNWERYKLNSPAIEAWESKGRNVAKEELKRASRHLDFLVRTSNSPFVYSPKSSGKSSREFFSIANKRIILLAMSSYDEVFANFHAGLSTFSPLGGQVFEDQIQWVKSTVDFVRRLNDVAVIIRPHPREVANKREMVRSKHSSKLEEALRDLPPNCFVDWPRLGFSIYDHFKEIDVLVTGWSSVGIEAMLSGIPCVSYDSRIVGLPRDIHFTGDSKSDYFANIEKSLAFQNPESIKRNALQWYAFAYSRGSVRLSGVLHDQFVFRHTRVTRQLADAIEFRFPSFAKSIEILPGKIMKDKKKLIDFLDNSADSLFEI